MSIESAKSFIEKMKSDDEFAKKVVACKNAGERMTFVKEVGFEFTPKEIQEVSGELNDKSNIHL